MEAETSIALSKIPNIVAIKESSGNIDQITKIISECPKDFWSIPEMTDLPCLPYLLEDMELSVLLPKLQVTKIRDMIDAFVAGNTKAAELHRMLSPYLKTLFVTTNPIPVKAALNLMEWMLGATPASCGSR